MTYQIVVPIYRQLPHIETNLESINDWANLLIIDNSPDGWCQKFTSKGAMVIHKPENIGVARSWNIGAGQGKDYTFFVSSSVKFSLGFKQVADLLSQLIAEKAPGIEYGLFTQLGWHCNGLSKLTFDLVGLFDPNFYPAYEEDVDMCRKLYLMGLHTDKKGQTLRGTIPAVVIDAAPIEIATTIKRAGLMVNFTALRKYYMAKWGGDHGQEIYATPFNIGDIKYYPEKSIEELKQEYNL